MENSCRICHQVFQNGDKVWIQVLTQYHTLPSRIAFAIGKTITDADNRTLVHEACKGEINEP